MFPFRIPFRVRAGFRISFGALGRLCQLGALVKALGFFWVGKYFSRKLQRRVLRQIASPIQHSITQHNITPQQDTPQQDPPQHHTPQQDIHRSKTPHLQTGLYCILIIFLIIS